MDDRKTHIRFLGGPYDGLEFLTSAALKSLATMAELPVSQDVLWALNGRLMRRRSGVKAVAIYAIAGHEEWVPYRFVTLRGVRPEELAGLDSWCNYVIRSEAVRIDNSRDEL
jgi:hypothetical protein